MKPRKRRDSKGRNDLGQGVGARRLWLPGVGGAIPWPVMKRRNVSMADEGSMPEMSHKLGGCNGGAQRPPCHDGAVIQHTSCVTISMRKKPDGSCSPGVNLDAQLAFSLSAVILPLFLERTGAASRDFSDALLDRDRR